MPEQRSKTRLNGTELHRELVPLSEATAVTYHIITEKPEALRDPRDLDDVRGLVAIALSTVATILKRENGEAHPLGSAQIEERLFSPLSRSRDRRTAADLTFLSLCDTRVEFSPSLSSSRRRSFKIFQP